MTGAVNSRGNTGAEFNDEDVVRAYRHRTAYPPALFDRLVALAAARTRAVDLGCGPGKLAIGLADHFTEVVAVDPSAPMLALGLECDAGRHENIRWVQARVEDFAMPPCDLAVAAASIHWMDHDVVFPMLCAALGGRGVLAIVDGDGPSEAPWMADYQDLISRWVGKLGGAYGAPSFHAGVTAHERWMDIQGVQSFPAIARQSVENFIESEHSRATWARYKMGPDRADDFDAELRRVLTSYVADNAIEFTTTSTLTWGRPRLRRGSLEAELPS